MEDLYKTLSIFQDPDTFVDRYPRITELVNQQLEIFWLPDEINVAGDIQSISVDFSMDEKNGLLTVLKLFTLYELQLGENGWGNSFIKLFKRPEFQRMGHTYAMMELAVHKPFYAKINQLLYIDNDEFYNQYKLDKSLLQRARSIDEALNTKDPLLYTAYQCLIEGAILSSAFAFIKSFQNNGSNKIVNINRGIDSSMQDEALHSIASAETHNIILDEINNILVDLDKELLFEKRDYLSNKINLFAMDLFKHESEILDSIFINGDLPSVRKSECLDLVKERINYCLSLMRIDPIFEVTENPMSKWFNGNSKLFKHIDFFTAVGSEYSRGWNKEKFTW